MLFYLLRNSASLDVTKQQDLSGFYRHLYKQTFSEDQPKKVEEPEVPVTFKKEAVESEVKSRRQYRSRREEEEEVDEEEEEEEPSPQQGTEQPEIPGDQSISNAEGGKSRSKEDRRPAASASLVSAAATDRAATADRAKKTAASDDVEKPRANRPDIKEEDSESDDDDDEKRSIHSPPPEEVAAPPKIKIDIWKKRTTGHLLEEAIQRYLARKEAREMN
jgi:coiled-coil domain-containing protein 55